MIEIKTIDDKYVEINGNLHPYYERELNELTAIMDLVNEV